MELPYVYVSILNWNSYQQTIRCIQLVEQQVYASKRIIVVDNASTDDSVQQIRKAFPSIDLINASTNQGYAAGHQLAVNEAINAKADLVWLLNTDIGFVDNKVLESLVKAYISLGSSIYGSFIVNKSNSKIQDRPYYLIREGLSKRELATLEDKVTYDLNLHGLTPQHVNFVSGASMLIPVTVIHKFGFMNQEFFLYSEEQDYCYSLYLKGVNSYLVPSSQITHDNHGTVNHSSVLSAIIKYYYFRNKLVVIRRYKGKMAYGRIILRRSNLKLLLKFIFWSLFFRNRQEHRFQSYMNAMAIWDSLLNRLGKTIAPEEFI